MITLEDCIAMCGLTEEEVLAIAEHEHIPEIAAAALAQYLLCQEHGAERIRDMLKDDIRAALARNDREHARKLFMALRDFLSMHPEGHPSLSGIMMCAAREPLRSLRPMWHKAPSVCALPRCRRLA